MKYLISIIVFLLATTNAFAQAREGNSLTIYSSVVPGGINPGLYRPTPGGSSSWRYNNIPGYGIVRNTRNVELESSISEIKFSDVAAFIDPTTVIFKSLTDPEGTSVLEQNYHFDLVSLAKLAERYLGKQISYEKEEGDDTEIISGKLLSVNGHELVLQKDDGSVVSTTTQKAIFPRLPGELYTKPTLSWSINTSKPGRDHLVETSYETGGMTWWADYNIVYEDGKDANTGLLDVGAWVTIVNKSGAGYPESRLKLIAGDVQKVSPPRTYGSGGMVMSEAMDAAPMRKAGFSQKAFFEYHLYTLGRPTSLPENSVKQLELFPTAVSVPAEKVLVYNGAKNFRYYGGYNQSKDYGAKGSKKVDVYLKFENEKAAGLGIPLPKGRVRVNKRDEADGSIEFIGEDKIDHTPKNEEVLLRLGNAFDIVGERTQSNFKVDHNRRWMQESFSINVRNHKEQDVEVIVRENLYRGSNWRITSGNVPHNKIDSNTVEFPIKIAADGEKQVRYVVEYTW